MGVTIVEKLLSANDIGKNGSHQAGMLIPKKGNLLDFFPKLNSEEENPRTIICFVDEDGQQWKFPFIYYNNKSRGGTRNEYRLTGMTKFFNRYNAVPGDTIELKKDGIKYYIRIEKDTDQKNCDENGVLTIVLNDSWKMIKI